MGRKEMSLGHVAGGSESQGVTSYITVQAIGSHQGFQQGSTMLFISERSLWKPSENWRRMLGLEIDKTVGRFLPWLRGEMRRDLDQPLENEGCPVVGNL